jgi:hypothetical protein
MGAKSSRSGVSLGDDSRENPPSWRARACISYPSTATKKHRVNLKTEEGKKFFTRWPKERYSGENFQARTTQKLKRFSVIKEINPASLLLLFGFVRSALIPAVGL